MGRRAWIRSEALRRLRAAIGRAIIAWNRIGHRRVARRFHYDLIHRTGSFGSTKWLGTTVWQNPLDLWTIQETLAEVRPHLLIETGTFMGGSALFYAHVMDLLDTGRVITIDIEQRDRPDHPRIAYLHGSSTDAGIVEQARRAASSAGGPVMVILDGNHDRDHVAAELELYGPLVTPGSYLLSQDGIIDQLRLFRANRPGPLDANRAFLARHPEYEHDRERTERYGVTNHPLGWLRRRAA